MFLGHFLSDSYSEAMRWIDGMDGIVWEKDSIWHTLVYTEEPDYDTFIDIGLRHGLVVAIED